MEKATFAAGCFWGVEAAFMEVRGVTSTAVGYLGGTTENPTYEDVCSGTTGHAEAVEVTFDPDVVSYDQLLDLFWDIHDPTTKDRQGPDRGSQYRSAIFFHSDDQQAKAQASADKAQASGRFRGPIVTQQAPATAFTRAEDHHQQYFKKQKKASFGLF